jgi:hypothetical protein
MLAHVGRRAVEMELEEAMIDVMGPEINDPLTHGAGVCGNWTDLVNLGVEWFFEHYVRKDNPRGCD